MKKFVSLCTVVALICMFASLVYADNGRLTGTVKDASTNAAISGATIKAGSYTTTTNSYGSYSLRLPSATYTVTASKTGYTSTSQSASITRNKTTTLNFSLSKTTSANGTLTGTVRNASTSAAISGATVTAGSATATTNSSGVYTLSLAAGSYTVTASASGFNSTSQSASVTSGATATLNFSLSSSTTSSSNYKIIAWNDLGMHCACPTFAGFLLLPPYNTVRAQVLRTGSGNPSVLSLTSLQSSGLTLSYSMVEDTDAILRADTYFASWIANAPKLFPGFQPVVNGKVMGLTGNGLYGNITTYDSNLMAFKAEGIPAYPVITGNPAKDTMIDPLGGPNRDPFLTANVSLKDSAGNVLASTSTVVPVAFGGCCSCHLSLAAANGYPNTPAGSFQYLGKLHGQNASKIDFTYIDPDGDGIGGPIRCSWCHWDPAMGESTAPGLATAVPNFKILAGASFTAADIKVSRYSFSDVLHRFHAQDQVVLSQYDPNIATNCYDCHPGNNVNCYRGAHKGKTAIWCVDCHGNLNQRIATSQLSQPWQQSTLPTCYSPSPGINSAFACHTTYNVGNTYSGLFGKFLNSKGHEGAIDCLTCHGSPHALAPSTLAADNVQLSNLQGNASYSFPSGKDKSYALGVCNVCHTGRSNTWGVPPHNSGN